MMNHKHGKSWISMIALALAMTLLPLGAMALTEDKLEPAPETAETTQAVFASQYLPTAGKPYNRNRVSADETIDTQFYASETNGFFRPWLTDLELARTRRLMEQAAAGEVSYTGRSIVNAAWNSDTGVSVCPLNPADYDGETFYVLLPQYMPLTDEQILALIAAFDELGIAFEPNSLGGRNCHRNTTNEARELTLEERQRLETIRTLVRRGMLTRKNVPEGTADCCIPRTGAGSDDWFFLYPYRSMTDDELTLLALHTDSRWEDDPLEIEQNAKDAVRSFYPNAGSLSVWDLSRMDRFSDPSDGQYYMLYSASVERDNWEKGDYLYANIELIKEYGHEPEIGYLEVNFSRSDDGTVDMNRTSGEYLAAAKKWAEANLQLPDGKKPKTWTVYEDWSESQTVDIRGETPDWTVSVGVYRSSLLISDAVLMSKKWQPVYEHGETWETAAYMPSGARPANREQVSADEKTDRQMVIRHSDYDAEEDGFYLPWLTDLELARTRKLMEQVAAGKVTYTGPSAANTLNGPVGVYPLNPEDFDGETFYVLLPQYRTLTDEQILSLIAAFDELGIPFDPDSLNARNCGRNMWFRMTRKLSAEEEKRKEAMVEQVRRGTITEESIPAGTADYLLDISLEDDGGTFYLYPYRSMTDDELARLVLNEEGNWEDNPDDIGRLAKDAARSILRHPGEIQLHILERTEVPEDGHGITSYVAIMSGGKHGDRRIAGIGAGISKEPGNEPEITWIQANCYLYSNRTPVKTDEKWIAEAREWATENLSLPDGQVPEDWTVEEKPYEWEGDTFTVISLVYRTAEWTLSVDIQGSDRSTWMINLYNRKWNPDK